MAEKWVNIDEVFPSACHGCHLEHEEKTIFQTDALRSECENCYDLKAYFFTVQGLGYVHNAANEDTFTHHEVSYEAGKNYI